MTTAHRAHDLVVFGATSFVGQILARYLYDEFGLRGRPRWAIAGRSKSKLEELRRSLGKGAAKLPMIVADASDEAALREMCAGTRVVASTVGPYALYGEPLIKACVEAGTDYCDLTGEPQWIRRMLQKYESAARKSGARIVHCCGFDSIPSDLGVHFLQREARERFGQPCSRVKMRVKAMSGGFSGGTVASAMNAFKEAAADPKLRKELADPYSLCPKGHRSKARQPNVKFAEYDADFQQWVAPFVMGAINVADRPPDERAHRRRLRSRLPLRRGRARRPRPQGPRDRDRHCRGAGRLRARRLDRPRCAPRSSASSCPRPAPAPAPGRRRRASTTCASLARRRDGRTIRAKVTGKGDPGYGSTSKILGQAAAMLALDVPRSRVAGGFWTPATIFGDELIDRLTKHAGLRFEVLES